MADLFGQQWGLPPLSPFLVDWGIGLVPPLLIRFVLMRRPVGGLWALALVALFGGVHYALFDAFGGGSAAYDPLLLVAIVSYLILTAGKPAMAPVTVKPDPGKSKAVTSKISAVNPDAVRKKSGSVTSTVFPGAPAEPMARHKPAKLEIPKPPEATPSAAAEEAELHRYDIAWRELESGKTHRGIWGRAFVKSDGNEEKTRIQYLKDRTEFLKGVEQRQEEQRGVQKLREQEIQKQKERERFEQMARLNKETLKQKEEQQYRNLLERISREKNKTVTMLKEGINTPDKWNEYKLTTAAQFGADENVFAHLAAGANPLLRDSFGHTARYYAQEKGRAEIAQYLAIAERLWIRKNASEKGQSPDSGEEIRKRL